ncbi:MAG: hypothetical protein ACLPSH_16385 [Vulcanimicrobiaceae bacterium]
MDQIDQLPVAERSAVCVSAHYAMLGRAGFDLDPVVAMLESGKPEVGKALARLGISRDRDLLFSPFQTVAPSDIAAAFPVVAIAPDADDSRLEPTAAGGPTGRGTRDHLFVQPRLVPTRTLDVVDDNRIAAADVPQERKLSALLTGSGAPFHRNAVLDPAALFLGRELSNLIREHGSANAALDDFTRRHASDTQTTFYPLVTHLFQLLGYRSEHSRAGVNYQRWDASVWIGQEAIPVEIKSPTEELYLSTKAVRQALENKVVLLSRGGLKTRRDITSLIVGFQIPNERGDMSMLIDNILTTYGLRIGVIQLRSLAALAMRAITDEVTVDPMQLSNLCGFLDV